MGAGLITVACIEWGNYLGRAEEYIEKLRRGVARHLNAEHRFVVLRPGPDDLHPALAVISEAARTAGTWQKLALFRPGQFTGRVLYLDLDSVIVGSLDDLVQQKGAVHLADWGWKRNVHAGGTLVWDAEVEAPRIWDAFTANVPLRFENDQEWMTTLGVWDRLPPHLVRSYRYHCKAGIPEGARVIAFHGVPKPHELDQRCWVHDHWS